MIFELESWTDAIYLAQENTNGVVNVYLDNFFRFVQFEYVYCGQNIPKSNKHGRW
jgi:hypothetical protein